MRVGHIEMEFIAVVCAINGRVTKMTHIFAVPGCSFWVHTNVRDVRNVMSGMYGVVVRCTQYLCW